MRLCRHALWLLCLLAATACRTGNRARPAAQAPAQNNDAGQPPHEGAMTVPLADADVARALQAKVDAQVAPAAELAVLVEGALREIMHEGKIGPRVSLSSLSRKHLYAIGPLSGLRGEVTIVDGAPSIAYPDGAGAIRIASGLEGEQAALLVSAYVERWQRVPITRDLAMGELDSTLEQLAREAGFDVERRLPMRIEGPVRELAWHVLAGADPSRPEGGHEHGHAHDAVRGVLASEKASLVGFFSKRDHGVFTHMGSNTHFHVVEPAQQISGHVDGVVVRRGAELWLPAL